MFRKMFDVFINCKAVLQSLAVGCAVVMLLPAACFGVYDIGDVVGDFSLPDLDGNLVSLYDFEGDIILLNFFATWCPPCNTESPILETNFWQYYQGEGVTVLAVDLLEDAAVVRAWVEGLGLTYPTVLAPDYSIWTRFPGAGGIPYNAIIDRNMVLRVSHYSFDEDEARVTIDELLELQPVGVERVLFERVKILFR